MITARVVRPLLLRPNWHLWRCSFSAIHSSLNSASLLSIGNFQRRELLTGTNCPSVHRNLHSRSRSLILPDAPTSVADFTENDSGSDSDGKKSRNEKKREARRSVRWGMELAAFSESQIKRILRVISAEPEVFDALMLVKRLGRDVREGKRRQFSYIGRLLREVELELMEGLIQATKDGDQQKFEELSPGMWDVPDVDDEDEETNYEDEEEGSQYNLIAARWFDGLIKKDAIITNEIYSISNVEFDRQELRRLVRKFCTMQGNQDASAENEGQVDAAVLNAKRTLARFLLVLAKQTNRITPPLSSYILHLKSFRPNHHLEPLLQGGMKFMQLRIIYYMMILLGPFHQSLNTCF